MKSHITMLMEIKHRCTICILGKTNSVVTFDDGFIQGNYSNYDGLGQLVINRTYNGGENITYSYEKNGKLIEPISITNDKPIQTYYNNGQLASEYQYVDGLFEGAYKKEIIAMEIPWIVANYLHDDVHGTYRLITLMELLGMKESMIMDDLMVK